MTPPTTGSGRPETRRAIFDAAVGLFEHDGYAGTGVREIALRAGVTPALVIRYFGSKEQLFLAAMARENPFTDMLRGPLETLGAELVRFVMTQIATPLGGAGIFGALMRASDRPAVQQSLQAATDDTFVGPIASRLSGPDAELRARLISAQHVGLLCALELLGDPVLRSTDSAAVARYYGRAIQLLIDG